MRAGGWDQFIGEHAVKHAAQLEAMIFPQEVWDAGNALTCISFFLDEIGKQN